MATAQFWLNILAVVAGPILAVQAQKWIERSREERIRKLFVFRELMATRAARLSVRHVEALNLIDLEYPGNKPKDKGVHEAWRSYFDALSTDENDTNKVVVRDKRQRAFVELMYQMATALNFPFDKVAIEKNVYSPVFHGMLEDDQEVIRRGVVDLLTGKRPLNTVTWVMPPQPAQQPQNATRDSGPAAEKVLDGRKAES